MIVVCLQFNTAEVFNPPTDFKHTILFVYPLYLKVILLITYFFFSLSYNITVLYGQRDFQKNKRWPAAYKC